MKTVHFNLNYNTKEQAPAPISFEEITYIPLAQKPIPVRPGYRFAGWYKDPECTKEWIFGAKTPMFMQPPTEWMDVKEDMTLYARWASPVHISTAKEFDAIRKDLYGWYVLDADIDLSAFEDWDPIGKYETDYEYADAEWWINAFKGRLDGNGHTIKGLSIKSAGEYYHLGIFGAMANAEVYNLTIESPVISAKGDKLYIGAIAGGVRRDKGREVILENICVKEAHIKAELDSDVFSYAAVASLVGGLWEGTIRGCEVSGNINVLNTAKGTAFLFVGGLAGEAYCETIGSKSDVDTVVSFNRPDATADLLAYIGGLQGGSTFMENSRSKGSIKVNGNNGLGEVVIGGISGSERYGVVAGCESSVQIEASGLKKVRFGGVTGEYNFQYAIFGMMNGVTKTQLIGSSFKGAFKADTIETLVQEPVCGSGNVPCFDYQGMHMDYSIEDC